MKSWMTIAGVVLAMGGALVATQCQLQRAVERADEAERDATAADLARQVATQDRDKLTGEIEQVHNELEELARAREKATEAARKRAREVLEDGTPTQAEPGPQGMNQWFDQYVP